jgi:hypothetical protein
MYITCEARAVRLLRIKLQVVYGSNISCCAILWRIRHVWKVKRPFRCLGCRINRIIGSEVLTGVFVSNETSRRSWQFDSGQTNKLKTLCMLTFADVVKALEREGK